MQDDDSVRKKLQGRLFHLSRNGRPLSELIEKLDKLITFGFEPEEAFNLLERFVLGGTI